MSQQAKQLKIKSLRPADEFHPGGFIFQIIDNDGSTIIKEWWGPSERAGILECRNILKLRAGEDLDFSAYMKGNNAKSE